MPHPFSTVDLPAPVCAPGTVSASGVPGIATLLVRFPEVFLPMEEPSVCALPLADCKVSAGFPSPATDYIDKRLDPNSFLVRNPVSTFFFSVEGDSMEGARIYEGDVLVVDRSVQPVHGHVVIAFINGERLVKRLHNAGGQVLLVAENPKYPAIEIKEGMDLLIWGVVVGRFARFPA